MDGLKRDRSRCHGSDTDDTDDTRASACWVIGQFGMLCISNNRQDRLGQCPILETFPRTDLHWWAQLSGYHCIETALAASSPSPQALWQAVFSVRHFPLGSHVSMGHRSTGNGESLFPRTWLHPKRLYGFPDGSTWFGGLCRPSRSSLEKHLPRPKATIAAPGPTRCWGYPEPTQLPQAPTVNDWSHWSHWSGDVGYTSQNWQEHGVEGPKQKSSSSPRLHI